MYSVSCIYNVLCIFNLNIFNTESEKRKAGPALDQSLSISIQVSLILFKFFKLNSHCFHFATYALEIPRVSFHSPHMH